MRLLFAASRWALVLATTLGSRGTKGTLHWYAVTRQVWTHRTLTQATPKDQGAVEMDHEKAAVKR